MNIYFYYHILYTQTNLGIARHEEKNQSSLTFTYHKK